MPKLEFFKSAGLGETPRLKAVVTKTRYTVFHRGEDTGWEWEELQVSSGFKSQADAVEDAKASLDAWKLQAVK